MMIYNGTLNENLLKESQINIVTVEYILSIIKCYTSTALSYPNKCKEILSKENPKRLCKTYTFYRDGWGCVYENIYCIELL